MSAADPLVTAEWLVGNISAPDVRVIDATWLPDFQFPDETGLERYRSGHVPGAVFFDIDDIADKNSDLPHMLPDAVQFSSAVRKLGLGDGNRIIVYDSNNYFASARVWWMFRVMGHEDVKVLDGGWSAWKAAGGDVEDLDPMPMQRHFTPRVRADLVRNCQQVAALKDAVLLDARSEGRFMGTEPEPRPELQSGHIPGSTNLPWQSFVREDGLFATKEEIEARLTAKGASYVCTCGSGVSAAVLALGLARLGIEAAVYDGSWSEWASDPNRPIGKGSA